MHTPPWHADEEALLKKVSEKISLSSAEESAFLRCLTYRTYPRKAFLLSPGDVCREQSIVVRGCLGVFYRDEAGDEHMAKFAVEHWWAFDITSFFESTPAMYGIVALESTDVFQLTYDNFQRLVADIPAFEKYYRLMLQQSFASLQYRMTQSLSMKAEERYAHFQQKYPGLENRIPQKYIASYLGITPEFLSMIRKRELQKH